MPKNPGSGVRCHEFVDTAKPVIMVLDQKITCAESMEIGRALGQMGYTARFVGGSIADFGHKYAAHMARRGETWQV